MPRLYQLLFAVSLLALSWLAMMAVHELGHVLGAWFTGGSVQRVVLHPLSISRTDVSPNPRPAIVVWLGPLVGCTVPLLLLAAVARGPRLLRQPGLLRKTVQFFAGFCLVANGAYIALGSFAAIGDCGQMLRTGTPQWAMLLFGALTIPPGLYLWHRLGSLEDYINHPHTITPTAAWVVLAMTLAVAVVGFVFSPR